MLLGIIASWFQLAFFIGVISILTIRLGSSFDWNSGDDNKQIDEKSISTIKQSVEKP
jgi:hypothetical protein